MERVIEKKTIVIHGDFVPSVSVGESVRPGTVLGVASTPEILEEYSLDKNTKVLVDDGVYVIAQTPLLSRRSGFKTEVIGALHEGIVRIYKQSIRVVASDDSEHEVKASVWGRIISFSENVYTLEIRRLKMPLFVSQGGMVEGTLLPIFNKGIVVSPQHVEDKVDGKIVVIPGALSFEMFQALQEKQVKGIIAPSVDWGDYLKIFSVPQCHVAILHGFGMFPLWQWYYNLFSKIEGVTVEVNFEESYMYVPVSDILLGSLEHDLLLFKEYSWGKQVKSLQHESGDLIASLETGEQTVVLSEELFNIR